MTIQVTLTFNTEAELVAYFTAQCPTVTAPVVLDPPAVEAHEADAPAKGKPGRKPKNQAGALPTAPVVAQASDSSQPKVDDEVSGANMTGNNVGSQGSTESPSSHGEAKAVAAEAPVVTFPDVGASDVTTGCNATVDDVRKAISDLVAAQGLEAAQAILKKFNAARISEVVPANYTALINEVKKAAE